MVARFAVYALSVAIVKMLKVKTINLPNGEPGSLRPPFWIINIEERKLSIITPARLYGTWTR